MTIRLNDSLQTEFSVEICDLWVATDTAAMLLPMVPRPGPSTPIDSLAQAEALMRTEAFVASDSVTIGATVLARFSGDSTAAIGSSAQGVLELVDTVAEAVVAVLDSFQVTNMGTSHEVVVESDHDLVSSVYALRLRLTTNVNVPASDSGVSRVPMGEVVVLVPDDEGAFARVRRASRDVEGRTFRIAVAPNPVAERGEARFSIATAGRVTVRLIDGLGHEAGRIIDRGHMERGRYAARIDVGDLAAGTYLLEVESAGRRETAPVVVAR